MNDLRPVLAIAVLLLGVALALAVLGFVRLPLAAVAIAVLTLIWAVEILRFRAATSDREKRP